MFRTLCIVLSWMTSTAALAATPGIEAFAALPLLERPSLSPDGKRYAGLLSSQGERFFVIVPILEGDGRPLKVALGAEHELLGWQWVNDDWLLVRVASTMNVQGEDWRVSRAHGINARDAKVVPIARKEAAQNGADVLWVARDGTPRALIAIQQSIYSGVDKFYPEVFEVDVSTGRLSSRARPRTGVMDWYADSAGNVRLGIGYNDGQRRAMLLYREKNGDLFRIIDRADLGEGESLTVPALFLRTPDKALAYSDHSGFDALYELDLATLTLGREVFSAPGYDLDGFHTDAAGTDLLGVTWTDTGRRTQWLEPVMSRTQRNLERAFGEGQRVRVVSMSRDQRRLIVHAGTAATPGIYYLADLDRASIDPLVEVQPALRDVRAGQVSSFRYHARDGLEIEAVLTLPPDRQARDLPLIVLPHGGPAARDEESWDWWSQYLAHLGYAVVQPNYRGSTGYGREFQAKGEGQWGLAMQDDLLDAIGYLAAVGTIDPRRVCIAGASYGGYAALRGAQRDGSHYRCAISYAGVSDLSGMLRYDSRFLHPVRRRAHWREAAPDLREVSPINWPGEFTVPVLLMHGKQDLRVPVKQSRTLADKLKKAGGKVRYVEQPLADHHFSREADRRQFLQEMTTFLQEHNPP